MNADLRTSHRPTYQNRNSSESFDQEDVTESDSVSRPESIKSVASSSGNIKRLETHEKKPTKKSTESEETEDLTLPELQRLVLLQQLQYYRKAEKLVDISLKRALEKEREANTDLVVEETDFDAGQFVSVLIQEEANK